MRTSNSPNLYRTIIPQDLIEHFDGRTRFHISLNNIKKKERLLVSVYLKTLTKELFNDIRTGMKKLTLEDVKDILKVEVNISFLRKKLKRSRFRTSIF